MKIEELSEWFVNTILSEFNDSPFQTGGPNLSNVVACMTQEFKRTFINCHSKGQEIRRRFCRYDSHLESTFIDLFVGQSSLPTNFSPMFDFK